MLHATACSVHTFNLNITANFISMPKIHMRFIQIKLHILNLINNTRQKTSKRNCNSNKCSNNKSSKSVAIRRTPILRYKMWIQHSGAFVCSSHLHVTAMWYKIRPHQFWLTGTCDIQSWRLFDTIFLMAVATLQSIESMSFFFKLQIKKS